MKKILVVIGTRPNYIKVTQLKKEFAKYPNDFEYKLLHTGQHSDISMAGNFFSELNIEVDYSLGVQSGTSVMQIGNIISGMDSVLNEYMPDLVIVVGDVNSTLAVALATHKAGIRLAHIESGLRSFDKSMPEEINRILTDEISDIYFVTEESAIDNLLAQGKNFDDIHFVGNTMIDTLVAFEKEIDASDILQKLNLSGEYVLVTMHRPSNVDTYKSLTNTLDLICKVAEKYKVVLPMHPRTKNNIALNGVVFDSDNIIVTEPLSYFSFQKLIKQCKFVLTDSGGIQEETTFRNIPCLTLRENTERPITIEVGTNKLVNFANVTDAIKEIESGEFKKGEIPELWDGKSTERIVTILKEII